MMLMLKVLLLGVRATWKSFGVKPVSFALAAQVFKESDSRMLAAEVKGIRAIRKVVRAARGENPWRSLIVDDNQG